MQDILLMIPLCIKKVLASQYFPHDVTLAEHDPPFICETIPYFSKDMLPLRCEERPCVSRQVKSQE
jgi:hypothetical protein